MRLGSLKRGSLGLAMLMGTIVAEGSEATPAPPAVRAVPTAPDASAPPAVPVAAAAPATPIVPAAQAAPDQPAATSPGSLRGAVTVDGKAEFRRVKIDEAVIGLSGGGLSQASPPAPTEAAVIDQKDIAYVPHILVARVGTSVEFRNSDNTLHNVHSACVKNDTFNLAMTPEQRLRKTFERPEVVTLTCNVHAEMKAYVVVLDNAFYARPEKEGAYRIEKIPAGTYKLRAWHEAFGTVVQEVTIKPGEEAAVNLNFESRKRPGRKAE